MIPVLKILAVVISELLITRGELLITRGIHGARFPVCFLPPSLNSDLWSRVLRSSHKRSIIYHSSNFTLPIAQS